MLRPPVPNEEQIKRRILFTPMESKDSLHDWIEVYLGIDIPDSLVDASSTISPMGAIWEVYDRCRRNDEDEFSRVLNYASRMSFKTLNAAVLEILMLFHLGRSVAHMAAVEGQAQKCQEYVKKFLRRPPLRDFVVGTNQRKVEVMRYRHRRTGESLPPKEWSRLPTQLERDGYESLQHYVKIVVCTMAGANSEHTPFMVIDEIDVVSNPLAYEEARAIPDSFEGKLPVTLLTSTRKVSFGLVQREINDAHKTGLKVHHWNILDVTERCPQKRHLSLNLIPDTTIYRSDETLRSLNETEYGELPEKQQELYVKDQGFEGCLKNCKMFAMCRGRLATHQKSDSKLLKRISQTQQQFAEFSPQMAKAQLLCWKPSTEGLIYPRLDRTGHLLTAAQIAQRITGEDYSKSRPKMTRGELVAILQGFECRWYAGMDFGFTHNFAVVVGVRYGALMFVLDVISQPELDLGQMISLCDERLKPYSATVYADPEDPGRIKTLKRAGYRMRPAPKPKGSVVGGIEIVRHKLWPSVGSPELFFLAEDDGVNLLFERMQEYHWDMDAAGRSTNSPDEEHDDECDALRYLVMNVFPPKGKRLAAGEPEETHPLAQQPPADNTPRGIDQHHRWTQMMEFVGMGGGSANPLEDDGDTAVGTRGPARGKKGGFFWNCE